MDLYEHEAKQIFQKNGIQTPKSALISNTGQITRAAVHLKPPFMVKAQVLSGGRGKAGGILSAQSIQEAQDAATTLFSLQIENLPVTQVLIEEKVALNKEIYVGVTIDRFNRCYILLTSRVGGVDIEETAVKTPKAITSRQVNLLEGFRKADAAEIAKSLGYSGSLQVKLAEIIEKLYQICIDNDAELVEINPLAEISTGFVALDGKMVIDDNALFRQPKFAQRKVQQLTRKEEVAVEQHFAYVELDGDIGVVGNGAGLVMATIDLLNLLGGKPADFLDLGGGANVDSIASALQIVLTNPKVMAVLVNVLGGITRCDEVARGIVEATILAKAKTPVVIRLVGTNQEEGKLILEDAGFSVLNSMEQAAQKVIKLAGVERLGHTH